MRLLRLKGNYRFKDRCRLFKNIHQMENLIQGQVVVPVAGGGTNKSEYELLTSNSMELMNTSSTDPFNILKLKNANSVVSILKQKVIKH